MKHSRNQRTFGTVRRIAGSAARALALGALVMTGIAAFTLSGTPQAYAATQEEAQALTVNLHNYNRSTSGSWNDINTDHDLQFGDTKTNDANTYTGGGHGVRQGIVSNTLEGGYPQLAGRDGESLEYLFRSEEEDQANAVTSYDDVTGLFSVDSEGYYVYDSSKNYAYFNEGSNSFRVYDYPRYQRCDSSGNPVSSGKVAAAFPQFLPFNDLTDDVTYYNGSQALQQRYGNYGEWGYYTGEGWRRQWNQADRDTIGYGIEESDAGESPDYSFGMNFTKTFYMPKDGKVNGQDMIFDFTGDDDVWVFIDGVLVLDLGGIHDAYSGTINFATGEVWVERVYDGVDHRGQVQTEDNVYENISDLFKAADKTWNDADYEQHTISFFYLERGDGGSNCRIRFNLPTIPEGTLEIGKQVTNTNTADFVNADFTMKVETADAEDGAWAPYVGPYELYTLDGDPVLDSVGNQVTGTTDNDGTFTLKHGQVARLTGEVQHEGDSEPHKIRANTWYRVTETGADGYSDDYEFKLSDATLVDEEGGDQTSNEIGRSKAIQVGEGDAARLVVQNRFIASDKYSVSIQKKMAGGQTVPDNQVFYMKVTGADGESIDASQDIEYYVHDVDGSVPDPGTWQTLSSDSPIAIEPDQEIVITNLALGTAFRVQEVDAEGTPITGADGQDFRLPTYEVNGTSAGADAQYAVVTVEHAEGTSHTDTVKVTNSYQVVPYDYSGLTVMKRLEGHALEVGQFDFTVTPVGGVEGANGATSDAQRSAEKAGWSATDAHQFENSEADATADEGVYEATARAVGHGDMQALHFTKDDIGQVYAYEYAEVDDDASGYTYDGTRYQVKIEVAKAEDGVNLVTSTSIRSSENGGETWGAWSNPVVSSAADPKTATITFENEFQTFGLDIHKIDAKTKDPLPNAYFVIYEDTNGNSLFDEGTDAFAGTVTDAQGTAQTEDGFGTGREDGIASFRNLMAGSTYFVKEVKVPAGYQLDDTVHVVSIDADGGFTYDGATSGLSISDGVLSVTIENSGIAEIPMTGSSGTLAMGTAGVATVAVAGFYLARKAKRSQ